MQLPENKQSPLLPPHAGLLKFCTVTELQNLGKSAKSLSSTYLRLISANGAVFAKDLQIYLETLSLQRENVPKLPSVLRLLLRKTGHWPVHDIIWHISELVVKRANDDIWYKKNLVQDNTKSKWHCKASGGFEHKIAGLQVVHVSVVVVVHDNTQKKSLAILPFTKWAQNQLLSSEICPKNFCKIGFFSITIVFEWNLSWIFPRISLWKSHKIWLFFCELTEAPCK